MLRILRDLIGFIWSQKKFWLVPVIISMVAIGAFIVFSEASPLSPMIYSIF